MYNKNPLMRNTLITAKEVIFHATTKHELDERMISQSIIIAEERFIKPELGLNLYQDMIDKKNVEVIDSNLTDLTTKIGSSDTLVVGDLVNAFELMPAEYIKLWKQYLWKLTAECVMVASYPEGFVQFGSEGTFHNSPPAGLMVTSGFVTPLLSSMKWAVDKKIMERISPLTGAMKEYICKNITDYPKYPKYNCPDCSTADNKKGQFAGIALDIYDDDDSQDCCEPGWMLK